jgi:hypothetical protein
VLFAKSSGCESSKRLVHPCMSQVSYKEKTKTNMVTRNFNAKDGLTIFPNNAHEAFLLTNGDISQENYNIQEKMHVSILSKVE